MKPSTLFLKSSLIKSGHTKKSAHNIAMELEGLLNDAEKLTTRLACLRATIEHASADKTEIKATKSN